jgi:hypothetical protein
VGRVESAVIQEVKGRCQTYPWWLSEIVGAINHVGAKALSEFIDCHLQVALPSMRTEKFELNAIIDTDQVVGDHADQAEGTGMVELVEEPNAN